MNKGRTGERDKRTERHCSRRHSRNKRVSTMSGEKRQRPARRVGGGVRSAPVVVPKCLKPIPLVREPSPRPAPRRVVISDGPIFSFQLSEDEDIKQHDWMQVNITIYSLSGVVKRTLSKKTSKGQQQLRRVANALKVKALPGSSLKDLTSQSTDSTSTPLCTNAVSVSCGGPPTTVVVACQIPISSERAVETFLPSLPLMPESVRIAQARYAANWNNSEACPIMDMEELHQSTFKMIRLMKYASFHRNQRQGPVMNYEHETVDLRVCIGRGKNMLDIGTASFAVSGDEEGEVMISVPVKSFKSETPRTRRNKKKPMVLGKAFPDEPRKLYDVSDNAILRIGVRVLPVDIVREARARDLRDQKRQERALSELLEGMLEDNHVIEFDDEARLLAAAAKKEDEKNNTPKKSPIRVSVPESIWRPRPSLSATPQQVLLPGFFCTAAMSLFDDVDAMRPPKARPPEPVMMTVNSPSMERAVVLPLSLMSSVSESLSSQDGSWQFDHQRATL